MSKLSDDIDSTLHVAENDGWNCAASGREVWEWRVRAQQLERENESLRDHCRRLAELIVGNLHDQCAVTKNTLDLARDFIREHVSGPTQFDADEEA